MDDENKQLQRLLDDATLKREHAQDRLRSLEVGGFIVDVTSYIHLVPPFPISLLFLLG